MLLVQAFHCLVAVSSLFSEGNEVQRDQISHVLCLGPFAWPRSPRNYPDCALPVAQTSQLNRKRPKTFTIQSGYLIVQQESKEVSWILAHAQVLLPSSFLCDKLHFPSFAPRSHKLPS